MTYPAITSREITGGMPGNPRQRISQDTQRTSEDHPGKILAFHKKSIGKAKTMRHSRKHAPNSRTEFPGRFPAGNPGKFLWSLTEYPEQLPGNSGGKSGKSKLARNPEAIAQACLQNPARILQAPCNTSPRTPQVGQECLEDLAYIPPPSQGLRRHPPKSPRNFPKKSRQCAPRFERLHKALAPGCSQVLAMVSQHSATLSPRLP